MKKRFTEEQIIPLINEVDSGMPLKEVCRKLESALPPTITGRPSAEA
jgi:hypothetical protein